MIFVSAFGCWSNLDSDLSAFSFEESVKLQMKFYCLFHFSADLGRRSGVTGPQRQAGAGVYFHQTGPGCSHEA